MPASGWDSRADVIGFVDVPTEQTTAVTDGVLALLALGSVRLLFRLRASDPWKAKIWSTAFACLLIGSALGAIAHGVHVSQRVRALLWPAIYLSLGLLVALFVVGAVRDLWGERAARRLAPAMIAIAVVFFAATQLIDGAFVVFVIYEAAALSFALLGYVWLALNRRLPGAGLMAAGILVTLAAAAIQATRLVPSITFVWIFDHNGLFHVVQMLGVVLIAFGLRVALVRTSAGP